MRDLIVEYNTNPNLDTIDSWWRAAAQHDLHHSVMLFGKLALENRKEKNLVLLPDSIDLLRSLSICGYYTNDESNKELARWAAEEIGLNKKVDQAQRELARKNQVFYIQNLRDLIGPFDKQQLIYTDLNGLHPNNPSILNWNNELWMIQRAVNYQINQHGQYSTGTDPIVTKNYLVRLTADYKIISCNLIAEPDQWPVPVYTLVQGFEDCRLFVFNNELWCTSTVREQEETGRCQILLAKINDFDSENPKFNDQRILANHRPDLHQKNWMPFAVQQSEIRFVYSCDPMIVINDQGRILAVSKNELALDNFRGGSQLITIGSTHIALIHESVQMFNGLREYVHRFIWINSQNQIYGISDRFKLNQARIEFVAGLTQHPDNRSLIISYGVDDNTSWLATISMDSLQKLFKPVPLTNSLGPIGPNV